jgi:two-component system cell cycle sensor histidine kinase/response regulator CckA
MHQTHTLATQPEGRPSSSTRFDRAGSVETVRSGRLVLLADDDSMVRLVVRLSLEALGFRVMEAENGSDAVIRAAACTESIALLVTDVMMPGLTGPEVCRAVRQRGSDVPTLFISGCYPEAVFPEGEIPPNAVFLTKPFLPGDLGEAVERLLGP